jgi:GTPase SAR1 family protein
VFLTYDITRNETFTNLLEWLNEIKEHAAADVKIYLIGNKAELEEKREVPFERAMEFAKAHNVHK